MSKISVDDVKKVAALSGFELSEQELATYTAQFEAIIGYIERLNTIETHDVEPTYQTIDVTNVMREDEIIDYGVTQSELLKNAPDVENSQIKVARVL